MLCGKAGLIPKTATRATISPKGARLFIGLTSF
jgi:hypothetical protein